VDVFHLRDQLVEDYREYVESFIRIKDERIRGTVEDAIEGGLLWPAPLVQLNPTFEAAETVDELVADGTLHPECGRIFRTGKGGGEWARPAQSTRPAHWAGRSGSTATRWMPSAPPARGPTTC
jgi:hypothetical protein